MSVYRNAAGKVHHGTFQCWVQADLTDEQLELIYPVKLGTSATVGLRQSNRGGTSFLVMASNTKGTCEDDVRGAVAALLRRALGWPEPKRSDPRLSVELVLGYCDVGQGHTTGSPRSGMTVRRGRRWPPSTPIAARG